MPLYKQAQILICGFVSAQLLMSVPAFAQRTFRLTEGQSKTVGIRGTITKVQVLNPRVADVANFSAHTATIVGVGPGTTELLLYAGRRKYTYRIIITKVEANRLFRQVKNYLGRIHGIQVYLIGDNVILSGKAITADDYGRAQRAVRLFGSKVRNLIRFKESAVAQINQIFKRNGLTDVHGRLVGGSVFLEGSVGSKEEMDKVKAILNTYGLQAENLIKVGGGKQILVDVEFVELRKGSTQKLGFSWPTNLGVSQLSGQIQASIPITPRTVDTASLTINAPIAAGRTAIDMLYSGGNARLLAQPKLVCGSGKKAEFLVGGEIPIPLITSTTAAVEYKEYGIRLQVQPTADSLGNVRVEILAEVSEPDYANKVQDFPAFRTRRFKTFVTVRDGNSIVLSGLFSNTEQKNVAKLPLLGHIPILGELFKSREFLDQKTTLVVFVTPRVVTSSHPWVRKSIKDIQRLYGDYKAEVGWKLLD
ncbi:MAG: pilus assembly protein N-terminal domain-containing protein [Deltaproteobacteria bacterium]|nr:pilus assembly protein N-terminal domain-containing protein [Deltaproteobacteria bacterium]